MVCAARKGDDSHCILLCFVGNVFTVGGMWVEGSTHHPQECVFSESHAGLLVAAAQAACAGAVGCNCEGQRLDSSGAAERQALFRSREGAARRGSTGHVSGGRKRCALEQAG